MVLSEKDKYTIIIKKEEGKTNIAIAEEMGISRKAVGKWVKRYKLNGNVDRKIGSGLK